MRAYKQDYLNFRTIIGKHVKTSVEHSFEAFFQKQLIYLEF